MTTVILNMQLKDGQREPVLERDIRDLCAKHGLKLVHDKSRTGVTYYSAAPAYVPSNVVSLRPWLDCADYNPGPQAA